MLGLAWLRGAQLPAQHNTVSNLRAFNVLANDLSYFSISEMLLPWVLEQFMPELKNTCTAHKLN
jgi:hypothetical protein